MKRKNANDKHETGEDNMFNKTVAFLGAGSMAEAMISGLVESGNIPQENIIVTNRQNQQRLNDLQDKYGIRAMTRDQLDSNQVDVYILAMKPKDVEPALDSIKYKVRADQLVLSVLAGVTTSFIEENLNGDHQVIRVMPNTSSMLGESATAMSVGHYTTAESQQIATTLLEMIGEVYTIEEDKMDIFTGIAGSGPAYFYYLVEQIEKAGAAFGLKPEMARQIGAQTLLGATKMMLEGDDTPAQLRENVTSPNGTTAAGLKSLSEHGGGKAMFEAIKSAATRSKEISDQLNPQVVNQ